MVNGGHISSLPHKARCGTMIQCSRYRDTNQGSSKHQVRYCISKPSQGVAVAVSVWPPQEVADAFGTKLGQAGSIPDRFRRLRRSTPFKGQRPGVEGNTRPQTTHTHEVRACAVRGLLRTLRWGYASLLVLIRLMTNSHMTNSHPITA
jgi:hypothetical protein